MATLTEILEFPLRSPMPDDFVGRMSSVLKTPTGTQTLRVMQAEALVEAVRQFRVGGSRGIFVRGGVGTGKTLIGLLLPTVLPPLQPNQKALYLCPAALRDKTLIELPEYKKNWKVVSERLLVQSYDELSRNPELLQKLNVYLVICDEAHALKNHTAARTRRVVRESRRNPNIIWVMMSATSSTRGIKDNAHLYGLALREGSPIPSSETELTALANCVDAVTKAEGSDWSVAKKLVTVYPEFPDWKRRWEMSGEDRVRMTRFALSERVRKTSGVITGDVVDVEAKLILRRVGFPVSPTIQRALTELAISGDIPGSGGASALAERDKARSQEQISLGFYYRWAWERTSSKEPDQEWLAARREWSSALTEYLAPHGEGDRAGIDSPMQMVQRMAEMPDYVRTAWRVWEPLRKRYVIQYEGESANNTNIPSSGIVRTEPIPVEPVWLDHTVLDRMVAELRDSKNPCVLWYKHRAVGQELSRLGCRVALSGEDLPWGYQYLQGDGLPVALSSYSHCEGLNLQAWSRMVMTCPGSAKTAAGAQLEQEIGRLHRAGQTADRVLVEIWQHTAPLRANLETAIQQATYIQQSTGIPQRLCIGSWESDSYASSSVEAPEDIYVF